MRSSSMTANSKPLVCSPPTPPFMGGAGSVSARDAIAKMLRDSLIVSEDGTPRSKHLITNGEPGAYSSRARRRSPDRLAGLRGPA